MNYNSIILCFSLIVLFSCLLHHARQHFMCSCCADINKKRRRRRAFNNTSSHNEFEFILFALCADKTCPKCKLFQANDDNFDFFPISFLWYLVYTLVLTLTILCHCFYRYEAYGNQPRSFSDSHPSSSFVHTSTIYVEFDHVDFLTLYATLILSLWDALFAFYRFYTTYVISTRFEEASAANLVIYFLAYAIPYSVLFIITIHVYYWLFPLLIILHFAYNTYCTWKFSHILITSYAMSTGITGINEDGMIAPLHLEMLAGVFFMRRISLICAGLSTCSISLLLILYDTRIMMYLPIVWSLYSICFTISFIRNRHSISKFCLRSRFSRCWRTDAAKVALGNIIRDESRMQSQFTEEPQPQPYDAGTQQALSVPSDNFIDTDTPDCTATPNTKSPKSPPKSDKPSGVFAVNLSAIYDDVEAPVSAQPATGLPKPSLTLLGKSRSADSGQKALPSMIGRSQSQQSVLRAAKPKHPTLSESNSWNIFQSNGKSAHMHTDRDDAGYNFFSYASRQNSKHEVIASDSNNDLARPIAMNDYVNKAGENEEEDEVLYDTLQRQEHEKYEQELLDEQEKEEVVQQPETIKKKSMGHILGMFHEQMSGDTEGDDAPKFCHSSSDPVKNANEGAPKNGFLKMPSVEQDGDHANMARAQSLRRGQRHSHTPAMSTTHRHDSSLNVFELLVLHGAFDKGLVNSIYIKRK